MNSQGFTYLNGRVFDEFGRALYTMEAIPIRKSDSSLMHIDKNKKAVVSQNFSERVYIDEPDDDEIMCSTIDTSEFFDATNGNDVRYYDDDDRFVYPI